jgi:hypothetical protein
MAWSFLIRLVGGKSASAAIRCWPATVILADQHDAARSICDERFGVDYLHSDAVDSPWNV